MKYASVCSGIEAATVAWEPLGWKPVWLSQFDPEHNYKRGIDFPSQVLQHHYPHVPNLGDMTKIRENDTYKGSEFDLLVGGTPCQAFSIAGLRAGLGDERSNLALEYIRILGEKQPRWFVWENVPGVLSSNGGADFACILSGFTGRDITAQKFEKAGVIEGDFYSIAWRVLDSQHFGVPQRRRRVFVVGHLGKDWRPPVAVLFERESLSRDFTPGGKKRKGAAGNTQSSTGGNSNGGGH
jgi:DNA (cytosine-5)-methyltransferase 1